MSGTGKPDKVDMTKLLPGRLQRGDVIGIISPSAPVEEAQEKKFSTGVNWLERMGFTVREGDHVRIRPGSTVPTPTQKGEDLNRMFADPEVRAIICSQGGDSAQECLPYIDWDCVRRNPKIFTGISDITVLLNAINRQTGLVTFHGNDLIWGLGRKPTRYDRSEFIGRFMDGRIGKIPAKGERHVIRAGCAEGMLLGGNLRCLLKLAGTSYFPQFEGAILFIEALRITPEICQQYMLKLEELGVFQRISGAIVGYIHSMQKDGATTSRVEEMLAEMSTDQGFPILKVNDFGHNCPNTVLPVGGLVRLDTADLTIGILDVCVK